MVPGRAEDSGPELLRDGGAHVAAAGGEGGGGSGEGRAGEGQRVCR